MQRANYQSYGRKTFRLLVLPATVILLLVNTFPLLYSCYISFTNDSLATPEATSFVGFSNFIQAFKDPMFLNALLVTVKFTLGSVASEFSLGLLIAVLLSRLNKGASLVLGLFLLPMMITPIIVGLLWRFMLNDETGLLNYFLALAGIGRFPFLATPTSLFSFYTVESRLCRKSLMRQQNWTEQLDFRNSCILPRRRCVTLW
jgi:multiple sugar transport system permease protein